MLRYLPLVLSNPAQPAVPPVKLDALVSEDPFGLVIGPQIAQQLKLDHVGLRPVEEIGGDVRLLPYAGPLRVTSQAGDAYTGAVICARGAIVGRHLAVELGIRPEPMQAQSATPVEGIKPPMGIKAKPSADLAAKIMIRENAVDEATCHMLREHAATHPRIRAGLVKAEAKTTEGVDGYVDTEVRDTFTVPVHTISEPLRRIFHRIVTDHVEPFYGFKIEWWENPQFLSYKVGGRYKPHVDAERWVPTPGGQGRWEHYLDRDVSVLLYVNDDFTGGALSFPKLNVTIQPKPGMLVAFPSSSEYLHGAEPVESGERLVLVSWMAAYGTTRVRAEHPNVVYMKDAVAESARKK